MMIQDDEIMNRNKKVHGKLIMKDQQDNTFIYGKKEKIFSILKLGEIST